MAEYIQFGNKKSTDFGLTLVNGRQLGAPTRNVEFVSIPGKSGDLIQDNKRFENYEDSYDFYVNEVEGKTLSEQARDIKNWLMASASYGHLVESWDSAYYRMAVCVNTVDIEQVVREFGRLRAIFNCKPQRYRLDGDTTQTLTAAGTLTNPEPHESLPYIKITGTGDITLTINDQTITLTGVSDYIEIDSELQSCFKNLVLQNSHYRSDFWPVLNIGDNQISWTGTVSKVEIKPRWWTL